MCCQLATKQHLRPSGSFGVEILGTGADYAKALPRGRLHDPPAVDCLDALRAEFFQPCHFRLDIVGFDIEVHPARMTYRLDFDVQAMLMVYQLLVDLALAARQGAHRQSERVSPKIRRPIEIQGLAID